MAELWPFKGWRPRGDGPIFGGGMTILVPFFEISSSDLFCPSFLSRMMGKPKFNTIGLEMAHLAHKTPILAHCGHYLKMRFSQNINFIGWYQIYSLKDIDMRVFACCRVSLMVTNVGSEFWVRPQFGLQVAKSDWSVAQATWATLGARVPN